MPFGASKQPCADPFRGKALRPCRRWRLQRHLCGPGRIVNRRGRGLGRRAGSQRRLRRLPTRLGRDSRREIAGGPAPSTPSGRLARGITCPPPGVNRDPPAQAPAETIRPGGRPEEPKRKGASQSEAKIIPPRAQQPRLVGISGRGVCGATESRASLTPTAHALFPTSCRPVTMPSPLPHDCARTGLLLGASVGALSSRCDAAA